MIRRFFRHIKEGFIGFGRHLGMAMSSVASVTITLLLIGLFLVMTINLNSLTAEIEDSISLSVILSYDIDTESERNNLIKQINACADIENIEYRTKDQEFDFYLEMYPDLADFYGTYRDQNPFHDVLLVSVQDVSQLQTIKDKISGFYGVDSVNDGGRNTYTLITILANVRLFGSALVICLTAMAVYLIYNTIRITIASRSDEIWIMRNVGARNSYIRAPFLVEGIIIGVIGSIVPISCVISSYYYIYNATNGVLLGVLRLIAPYPFIIYASLSILGLGVLVGYLGSYLSVCKFLRRRR